MVEQHQYQDDGGSDAPIAVFFHIKPQALPQILLVGVAAQLQQNLFYRIGGLGALPLRQFGRGIAGQHHTRHLFAQGSGGVGHGCQQPIGGKFDIALAMGAVDGGAEQAKLCGVDAA